MYISLAICAIIISITIHSISKNIRKQKQRQKIIDIQKKEIAKFNNVSEYLITNKDKIKLYRVCKEKGWLYLGYLDIEIHVTNETFVKINGIDYGFGTELSKVLTKIYYRDREKFLF